MDNYSSSHHQIVSISLYMYALCLQTQHQSLKFIVYIAILYNIVTPLALLLQHNKHINSRSDQRESLWEIKNFRHCLKILLPFVKTVAYSRNSESTKFKSGFIQCHQTTIDSLDGFIR